MTQHKAHAVPAKPPRDTRIDLFRGLALATIFVNHVPGTVFEHYTTRNYGFSDAAEAFVMISGTSAALAYGRHFGPLGNWWQGLWRCWGRAWTLYLVQMVMCVIVLAMLAAVLRFLDTPDMILRDNFRAYVTDPIGVFIGVPLLLHQFGYIDILPVYIVLILAAPFILTLGRRAPMLLLALSVALWFAAGVFRFNFPVYPNQGGWFLNPFSWQLIFVIGALTGLSLARGERFVPVRPWLVALAAGFLLLSAVWLNVPAVQAAGNKVMVFFSQLGAPRVLTNFNKNYVEAPRLLHILALAYVLSVIPGLRRLSAARWLAPLTVMGRQALPVFATGTILAFAGKTILLIADPAPFWLDAAVIWGGIAALVLFAFAREAVLKAKGGAAKPTQIAG